MTNTEKNTKTNKEKYANPTYDWSFKKIFLTKGHENILKTFINDALDGDLVVDQITAVQQPEKTSYEGKKIICDIQCRSDQGVAFVVEIQREAERDFAKRLDYYRARATGEQIKSAEHYGELKPTIVISICDFGVINLLFPGAKGVYFEKLDYMGRYTKRKLEGPPHFIFFDLVQYRKMKFPKNSLLEEWFQIFTCHDIPEAITLTRDATKMALDDLDIDAMSLADKKALEEEALARVVAENAQAFALEEAKSEGKAEEKKEIARNMKLEGITATTIAKITGLSEAEIKKL